MPQFTYPNIPACVLEDAIAMLRDGCGAYSCPVIDDAAQSNGLFDAGESDQPSAFAQLWTRFWKPAACADACWLNFDDSIPAHHKRAFRIAMLRAVLDKDDWTTAQIMTRVRSGKVDAITHLIQAELTHMGY